ncbi:MAG: hypothetical protein J5997_00985 [Oscillospiraceae bacterium]|nr:hypothetical protein [Oscillospiraceae bacterium]
MNTDFYELTPCGGNCTGCEHFCSGECKGCIQSGGKCVKMWDKGCDIYKCCQSHGVTFCGICGEFPCKWLKETICRWEEKGIERLQSLGEEHKKQHMDFEENISRLWKSMGSHGVMTLSTCARGRVSSRPMSVVVIDGKFYCQTDISYLKCIQIRENLNVALCVKNFSIEGKCQILEEPVKYDFFMRAMKKHYLPAALRYSSLPSERVLEITPSLIYLWDYHSGKPYMEFFEFRNNTYRKEWK